MVGVAQGGEGRVFSLSLPNGHSLPPASWANRHFGVLCLLAAHAAGLAAFGLYMGTEPLHAVAEASVVGLLALVAALPQLPRRARSVVASFGLMSSSAVLTHLSGGYIEAHFHFFVMLGVIFLYEDWLPYSLAVAYVAIHHGLMGTLDPLSVYNHPSALADPWRWATIHALFILGLSAALIVAWNVIERARASETAALAEAQDLKRQLHTQEKMAALGSLISGLAHEVRTPLTVVSANASLLEMEARRRPADPLAERVLEHAREIQTSVDRMNALVHQLRRFHNLAADEMVVAPLDRVVREAVVLFSSVNRGTARIEMDIKPGPPIRLHPLGMHQVVLNLLSNAVEATTPATGVVRVRTGDEGGRAVLVVEDNGSGMTHEVQRRMFDPLFTTKKEGMGLGLHIVMRIVKAHGADVECESEEGKGTRFIVRFPSPAPQSPMAAAAPFPLAPGAAGPAS